jgi:ABC-2 type transport system permease protein
MGNTWAILTKEVKSYLNSPVAYLFVAAFLGLTGYFYFEAFFLRRTAELRSFFELMPALYAVFLPALTMRLWAEEKKSGTLEVLLTMPVRNLELVLGKFLASLCLLVALLLLTVPVPVVVASLGPVDIGPIIGGYLGSVLLGASFLAVGLFFSSMTESQFVALILTWAVGVLFVVMGLDFVTRLLPVFTDLSLYSRFDNIARGVVDSRDLVYYISFISFFLGLNLTTLELRRWR